MSLRQNTSSPARTPAFSLVTSQNVTAPKRLLPYVAITIRLVTSQNVTAPKQVVWHPLVNLRLVTSQNVTAPKRD